MPYGIYIKYYPDPDFEVVTLVVVYDNSKNNNLSIT